MQIDFPSLKGGKAAFSLVIYISIVYAREARSFQRFSEKKV